MMPTFCDINNLFTGKSNIYVYNTTYQINMATYWKILNLKTKK